LALAAKPERAVIMYHSFTNSVVNHTYHYFCYNNSNYHRSTEIKVYCSDIHTDVYGSDKNTGNHLLKVTVYQSHHYARGWGVDK